MAGKGRAIYGLEIPSGRVQAQWRLEDNPALRESPLFSLAVVGNDQGLCYRRGSFLGVLDLNSGKSREVQVPQDNLLTPDGCWCESHEMEPGGDIYHHGGQRLRG